MPDTTSIHIADDPERLEEFVLGRLADPDRAAVESHAASCDRCSQAIRNERVLAAGAKRLGRTLLKETLKRRIAQEEPAARVPWPRILSAAAVIVLLLGVGWLNHWFLPPEGAVLADKAPREIDTAPPSAASPSPAPSRADRDGLDAGSASARPSGLAKKMEQPAPGPGQKTRIADDARPARRDEVADIAAAETRNSVVTGRDLKIAPAIPGPSGGIWVEGNALTEGPAGGAYRAGGRDAVLPKGKSDARTLAEKEPGALAGAGAAAPESARSFRVLQRTSSALPALRQNLQQKNESSGTIQTLMEQKPGETVLTLYLDSLRNPQELRNARVERVAVDSIIVNIGNQRIGYRLPGMMQQEQQQAK